MGRVTYRTSRKLKAAWSRALMEGYLRFLRILTLGSRLLKEMFIAALKFASLNMEAKMASIWFVYESSQRHLKKTSSHSLLQRRRNISTHTRSHINAPVLYWSSTHMLQARTAVGGNITDRTNAAPSDNDNQLAACTRDGITCTV